MVLRTQNGFSLVEALVAAAVLAIGLLAMAAMPETAIEGTAFAGRMSAATNLAEEMMERIRLKVSGVKNNNLDIDHYNNMNTIDPSTRPAAFHARGDYDQWKARIESPDLRLPAGIGTVTVQIWPPLGTMIRKQVQVEVSWQGRMSRKGVTLQTLITE